MRILGERAGPRVRRQPRSLRRLPARPSWARGIVDQTGRPTSQGRRQAQAADARAEARKRLKTCRKTTSRSTSERSAKRRPGSDTAPSPRRRAGRPPRRTAAPLAEQGEIGMSTSDVHSSRRRPPRRTPGLDAASSCWSACCAALLACASPALAGPWWRLSSRAAPSNLRPGDTVF